MGQLASAYSFGGPTLPGRGKGGPLIKNIDNVKFEMGPTFPIWPGPITTGLARACFKTHIILDRFVRMLRLTVRNVHVVHKDTYGHMDVV